MLSRDQTMDILLLHKQGHSIRRIARDTGHSGNTVRQACVRARRGNSEPRPVPQNWIPLRIIFESDFRSTGFRECV
jgi:transposase